MNTSATKDPNSASNSGNSSSKPKTKTVVIPIDLPGQPIQCWTGDVEKIKVILRKHRDVIFDIGLGGGRTYSVRSELSEMYDTRTKKLIHPREEVIFKDGEMLHLWVSRNFKGKIFLFEGANKISSYELGKFDNGIESFDPEFKPPPISIIMKNEFILGRQKAFEVVQLDGSFSTPSISEHDGEKFIQIFEINMNLKDVPKEISDFFKKGGEKEIMGSFGVATRNWIFNQIIAQSLYVSDNKDWMKELWSEKLVLKSVVHRNAGMKMYAILSGSNRARRLITAARYCSTNTKILAFSFGAGSAAGIRHAAWSAAKGNFRGSGRTAMLFTITLDIAEWINDYEQRDPVTGAPKQDVADLFIKVGIDIAKNVLNSILVNAVMGTALTLLGGAPVIVIIVGTILVTVLVGFAIDYLDKKYGLSEKISSVVKNAPSRLEEKIYNDYRGYIYAISHALKSGGFENDF